MSLSIIILAAGQGSRMRSTLPKVLHEVGRQPMLQHVIRLARSLDSREIRVVYGHGGDQVQRQLADQPVRWCEQAEQLGTGHAVLQGMSELPDDDMVMILYGDVPLTTAATLTRLQAAAESGVGLLTVKLAEPTGYGRVLRNPAGEVQSIVEQNDASPEQLAITEVNTGVMAMNAGKLREWLGRLGNNNAQGEYYLTDVIAMAVADGLDVMPVMAASPEEVAGVNDRVQLAKAERVYQLRQAEALMLGGATLADPARVDVRGAVSCGNDVHIDVNVVFEGQVSLGNGVRIGANCVLVDCSIADGAHIKPFSHIESASVGPRAVVGPYARLRPGADLAEDVRVGNFCEIKNAILDAGAKVNHLSYIGDARVGSKVNVGAGTITCNYDGANKHHTAIGAGAFIGSGTQLVAPVNIGANATIGAGSVITREAPAEKLTVARGRQRTLDGWQRPVKQPKNDQ